MDSTVPVAESIFVATDIPGRDELAVVSNTISLNPFDQDLPSSILLQVSPAQNAIAISSAWVVVPVVFVLLEVTATSLYVVRAFWSSGVGLQPKISRTPAELAPGVVVAHDQVTEVSVPSEILYAYAKETLVPSKSVPM